MQYGPPPLFKQGIPAKAIFIVYTILSIILILIDSRLRVLEPVRIHVRTFLSPIQTVVNLPFSAFASIDDLFAGSTRLVAENQRLRLELEALRLKLAHTDELAAQNSQLRELLLIRKSTSQINLLLVEIKGEVGDQFSRNLVLDQGTNSGIRLGMPVIDSLGLMGQITRVYPDQSEVMLITSKNVQVPVQVERTGLRAVCEGVGEIDMMHILFVPLDADIAEGDRITTSGIDGVFPRNTLVGIVSGVRRYKGQMYAQVDLKPVTQLRNNHFARVVLSTPEIIAPPKKEEAFKPQRRRLN